MVKITDVERRSHAERAGLTAGDTLLKINGNEINDVLDYRFYLAEKKIDIEFLRDGEPHTVRITKGEYSDIGLGFETPLMDEKRSCKNGCIFCFIDQNPKGMRESIYFKDDDSRLSFLHGNYITLTNLTDCDVDRIVKMRFSPINVSIHTTNPELRVKMMKNKRSGEVLKYLDRFYEAGLSMCGQIVLCRGVNDGEELLRSMRDLSKYQDRMNSVSIVPAGLTKHRDGLYPLSDFTPDEAAAVIDMVECFAAELKAKSGSRMFFLADEFYLKAGRELPDAEYYEEYPQLENGVGMLRSFGDDFNMGAEDANVSSEHRTVSLVTGVAAYPMIAEMATRVEKMRPQMQINVYKIINHFFGESITVAGLLTGRDILAQLEGKPLGDLLLIPSNALRAGEETFLCGMTVSELSESLGVRVVPIENDGYELATALLEEENTDV